MVRHVTCLLNWSIELFSAIRQLNFDVDQVGSYTKLQISKLEKIRNDAYDYAKLYKERMMGVHDLKILRKSFRPGEKILLYNSCLYLFLGKLKFKWPGPFTV